MITQWRTALKNPALWFGFVQIAGFGYSHPWGNPPQPEVDHSHAAGDLRQAQLAALALDNGATLSEHPSPRSPCVLCESRSTHGSANRQLG